MSGSGYGSQQGAGWNPSYSMPQQDQGAQAMGPRMQSQGFQQQPYQGQQGQQPYQGQQPAWLGNLMSMFQRPGGMGQGSSWQGSNPAWQPRPVQMPPQQTQIASPGTNIFGQPIGNPATNNPGIAAQFATWQAEQQAAKNPPPYAGADVGSGSY